MAKVTITLEDLPGGKVEVVSTPSIDQIMSRGKSGHVISMAEDYALNVLNEVMGLAKKRGKKFERNIPIIGP